MESSTSTYQFDGQVSIYFWPNRYKIDALIIPSADFRDFHLLEIWMQLPFPLQHPEKKKKLNIITNKNQHQILHVTVYFYSISLYTIGWVVDDLRDCACSLHSGVHIFLQGFSNSWSENLFESGDPISMQILLLKRQEEMNDFNH